MNKKERFVHSLKHIVDYDITSALFDATFGDDMIKYEDEYEQRTGCFLGKVLIIGGMLFDKFPFPDGEFKLVESRDPHEQLMEICGELYTGKIEEMFVGSARGLWTDCGRNDASDGVAEEDLFSKKTICNGVKYTELNPVRKKMLSRGGNHTPTPSVPRERTDVDLDELIRAPEDAEELKLYRPSIVFRNIFVASIVDYELKRRKIVDWDASTPASMNEEEKFQQSMKLVIIKMMKDVEFHALEGNWLATYETDFDTTVGTFLQKCIVAAITIFRKSPFSVGLKYNGVPADASLCLARIAMQVYSERIGAMFRGTSMRLWRNDIKIDGWLTGYKYSFFKEIAEDANTREQTHREAHDSEEKHH